MLFSVITLFLFTADQVATTAVMPLQGKRIDKATTGIVDDLVVTAVDRCSQTHVISPSDINAMLGLERLKDAAGCDDISCATEISNALGASFMVNGSISKLGNELIVTLTLINVTKRKVDKRVQRRIPNDERLLANGVEALVSELYHVAAPPPKSAATPPAPKQEQPQFATVHLDAGVADAFVQINGESPIPLPAQVKRPAPAQYAFRFFAHGHAEQTLHRLVSPGQTGFSVLLQTQVSIDKVQASRRVKMLSAGGTLSAVGGASLATAAILYFGVRKNSDALQRDYETFGALPASESGPAYQRLIADTNTSNTLGVVSPILLAVGIATAVPGILLLILAPAAPKASLSLSALPNVGGASLAVAGGF